MKNTKKIVSLILAICMIASLAISASAANTVDASGGTGTSSVTLSSTADGSLDGDPSATKMSVVVPTVLPIAVGTDGSVATASDAKIINNSYGAVKVNSVSIEAAQLRSTVFPSKPRRAGRWPRSAARTPSPMRKLTATSSVSSSPSAAVLLRRLITRTPASRRFLILPSRAASCPAWATPPQTPLALPMTPL